MGAPQNFLSPDALAGLDDLEMRARTAVEGFLSGLHRSPHRGFSVEFNDYRRYQRGDDMRHVDWRLYARSDRLYVKQYEDETNARCVILLDVSASMAYGSGGASKLEYGVTLASALAYLVTRQRDAAGLITFDDRVRERIPPKCRRPHLMRILGSLSRVEPGRGTDAARPLADLAASLTRKSMVILITDFLDGEERTIGALRNLRGMGNDVIAFQTLDGAELELPFGETSEFIDMESGESFTASPPAVRRAYLERLGEFLARCRRGCLGGGVDHCLLNTSEPLDRALSSYLSRRARSF